MNAQGRVVIKVKVKLTMIEISINVEQFHASLS